MYKNLLVILLGISLLSSCQYVSHWIPSHTPAPVDTMLYSIPTQIHFIDSMVDLGDVNEGDASRIIYRYQNIGDKPLMLLEVSPSCGCTIAEFSHQPLAPNGLDSIIANFDSKNKDGRYQKNIKVNANTPEKVHNIAFKVNVIKKK